MHMTRLGFFLAASLLSTPTFAMNWVPYAPDDKRLFLDRDNIVTQGDYTYFVWAFGSGENVPPTTSDGFHVGINCLTGETQTVEDGQWVAGDVWPRSAYLYQAVCNLPPQ